MSLSSGERKVRGFRTDSNPQANTDSKRFRSRESGMGWDGMGKGDLPPFTERRAKEFAWAERHLPDEHPGLVVSALISLELAGENQSTKTVLARLHAQSKTAEQMREKGWL